MASGAVGCRTSKTPKWFLLQSNFEHILHTACDQAYIMYLYFRIIVQNSSLRSYSSNEFMTQNIPPFFMTTQHNHIEIRHETRMWNDNPTPFYKPTPYMPSLEWLHPIDALSICIALLLCNLRLLCVGAVGGDHLWK